MQYHIHYCGHNYNIIDGDKYFGSSDFNRSGEGKEVERMWGRERERYKNHAGNITCVHIIIDCQGSTMR